MSDNLETFKSHAVPLGKLLLQSFPNGATPTFSTVHPDANSPTEQQENALKEVVHFFVNEKLARQSTVQIAQIVLTKAGLKFLGQELEALDLNDN
ncbi:hypothetical protein [Pseudoalteromonas sp. Of7M-16]|uniref:hypothetical protein n=1 Tax=Pseudoalteromonas sp. Of7M-16 TaxID=2917756 RepID=UPI001EF60C0A|nr:hypothetical protein [Pseudoalteromonas sp. Of7M-16]MCG7547374.1 hypothetical protein [Pseudoalteromonas sp. Of7M-16]